MRIRWQTVGAVLLLPLAAACRDRESITFEQFVNTTVELRQAANQTTSPQAFDERKRAIEARHRVTDADLDRYVRGHADDVKLLSAAWDSVEARLGRAGVRDAATRPTPRPQPVITVTPGSAPTTVVPSAGGGTPPRPGRHNF